MKLIDLKGNFLSDINIVSLLRTYISEQELQKLGIKYRFDMENIGCIYATVYIH